jgi:hypothetical protein
MTDQESVFTGTKWKVRKITCGCHAGKWSARLPGLDYALLPDAALARRYATDGRFRAQWKAGQDLARQYPLPLTAAMKGLAL